MMFLPYTSCPTLLVIFPWQRKNNHHHLFPFSLFIFSFLFYGHCLPLWAWPNRLGQHLTSFLTNLLLKWLLTRHLTQAWECWQLQPWFQFTLWVLYWIDVYFRIWCVGSAPQSHTAPSCPTDGTDTLCSPFLCQPPALYTLLPTIFFLFYSPFLFYSCLFPSTISLCFSVLSLWYIYIYIY